MYLYEYTDQDTTLEHIHSSFRNTYFTITIHIMQNSNTDEKEITGNNKSWDKNQTTEKEDKNNQDGKNGNSPKKDDSTQK